MSRLAQKKRIAKEIKGAGLAGQVDESAIDRILTYLQEQGQDDVLLDLLRICQAGRYSVVCYVFFADIQLRTCSRIQTVTVQIDSPYLCLFNRTL